jgi:Domain of unknown function (DUF4928)
MINIVQSLADFAKEHAFQGKGPLCVALVLTDHARTKGLPLEPSALVTAKKGQVLGLGKSAVQAILKRNGINKVLASEGGRTSRGSIDKMQAYVQFLNIAASIEPLDLDVVETFWIERVQHYFSAKPFTLKLDSSLSVRAVVRALMGQVESRQRESQGAMIVGTVMQHFVGAKLQTALGVNTLIEHHSANTNDAKARGGDFDIGDVSIHVTAAPSQALMEKCHENLGDGRKPIIVTTRQRSETAESLAEDAGLGSRLDVIEFEQFIATNIHELGAFEASGRTEKITEIVFCYNAVIDQYETDPSLKIEIGQKG